MEIVSLRRHAAVVEKRERGDGKARAEQALGADSRNYPDHERSEQGDYRRAWSQDQARVGGRISEQRMQHLGYQHGAAEESEGEQKIVQIGDREVAFAQQCQLDHRIVMAPFPPNRDRNSHKSNSQKGRDEMTFQPVVALTPVQHHLEKGKSDRDQADSHVVNPKTAATPSLFPFFGKFDRIMDQPARQQQRQQSDRNIDEEDPSPREVVGDPSAQRRPDSWGGYNRHAVKRESPADLLLGKGVDQNRLLDGRQAAAANSLEYAEKNQQSKA